MAQFLALLTLYYSCDAAAVTRPMTSAEVAECMEHYGAVKSYFVADASHQTPGLATRGQRNKAAYVAFKAWEDDHSELVRALRTSAAD